MFKKILIANRGEIALRIIQACRELGIQTVAVLQHRRPRQPARHLRRRGRLHRPAALQGQLPQHLGASSRPPRSPAPTPIHPGYGFLAENAHFAEVLQECKLAWIGPRPEVIRLMGDKAKARQTAGRGRRARAARQRGAARRRRGGARASPRRSATPSSSRRRPAAAGAACASSDAEEELAGQFSTAREEAERAFGDGSIYLEKYLVEPRHIEFQVFGDRHGRVIHLGERECSIQRRHQKLIEESPSPALTPELRDEMGDAAVRALRGAWATRTPAPSSSCSTATAASTSWR